MPGAWRPSRLHGRRSGVVGVGGLHVGQQVPGAGQQLAGDRDGGDLLPAAFGDGRVGGGELRGPLGGLRRLVQDPPQPGRALLGDVPVPDGQVRAADGRGQPGPAGQLAGAAEPGDVADLGQHDQRGELPDAGQRPQYLDPRVGLGVRRAARRRSGRSAAPGRR